MNYEQFLNAAVAAELTAAHQGAGLSRRQLSKVIDVPLVSLDRYLTGRRQINVKLLGIVADASKIDASVVMERAVARAEALAAEATSAAPDNVTDFPALDPDDTGAIEMYEGDKAAYRDPEADTDET